MVLIDSPVDDYGATAIAADLRTGLNYCHTGVLACCAIMANFSLWATSSPNRSCRLPLKSAIGQKNRLYFFSGFPKEAYSPRHKSYSLSRIRCHQRRFDILATAFFICSCDSCSVLFCHVLPCPFLFCHVLSCLVTFSCVLSCSVLFHFIIVFKILTMPPNLCSDGLFFCHHFSLFDTLRPVSQSVSL